MSVKLLAPIAGLLLLTLAACGDAPDTEAPPADAAPAETDEATDPAVEPDATTPPAGG